MIAAELCFDFRTSIFVASAMLLPFIGYYLAFYNTPAFAGWSRINRPLILTLSFVVASIVGFFALFYLEVFIAFGGHRW